MLQHNLFMWDQGDIVCAIRVESQCEDTGKGRKAVLVHGFFVLTGLMLGMDCFLT